MSNVSPAPSLPDYERLPVNEQGVRSAWGIFGAEDSLGLVNLLTQEVTRAAAALVRRGAVFPLDAPLDHFDPPLFGRPRMRREVQPSREGWALNEVLHDFNPQSSSQWDALSHVSYQLGQFYNGASLPAVLEDRRNTVGHWARHGLVGRGVLLDLERTAAAEGRDYDPGSSHAFTVADLEQARAAAGVELVPGDFLVLRTGFFAWYAAASPAVRQRISAREELAACGLEHTEEMARYLWNSHACAVAADCPSVEVWPMDHSPAAFPFGCLHQVLLGQFGLALGELWSLEALAEDCARDGVHEFMLTSAPLNMGGFGSPANVLAIK
ncbi:MAG: cyclase family protein [Mycobacteriales bacterium]